MQQQQWGQTPRLARCRFPHGFYCCTPYTFSYWMALTERAVQMHYLRCTVQQASKIHPPWRVVLSSFLTKPYLLPVFSITAIIPSVITNSTVSINSRGLKSAPQSCDFTTLYTAFENGENREFCPNQRPHDEYHRLTYYRCTMTATGSLDARGLRPSSGLLFASVSQAKSISVFVLIQFPLLLILLLLRLSRDRGLFGRHSRDKNN